MNPEHKLFDRLSYLLKEKKTIFELCTSQEFSLAKQAAIRKLTKEKVDILLHQFFNQQKE